MKPILAAIAALSLAGCTTTSFDPAASVVYVQSAGGHDVSGTIPPLHYVAAATNALEAGRLTITPMASIAASCGTVDHHGCVRSSGAGYVILIDATLPAWARDLFSTALMGHVGQRITGQAENHAGWSDPSESLIRRLGAGTAAASRPATIYTYAHTWGGEPPEPYASAARRLIAAGGVRIRYWPLSSVEELCGRRRDSNGWVQMACSVRDADGPFIVVANEAPASVRDLLILHEAAHADEAGDWPETAPDGTDHPGALKPVGHLDACIRSMNEAGLSVRQMGELCNLYAGAPLRTQDERDRWAAMN